MDMFITFNGVMFSWVSAYVQAHQIVYIKQVLGVFFFAYQSFFDTGVNH